MASGRLTQIAVALVCAAMLARVLGDELRAQAVSQSAPPAESLVSAALKTAQAGRKVVLIEFGASWCTWCRSFDAFVHAPEVKRIIADNYVIVNVTVQENDAHKFLENAGGQETMNNWGGAKSGLPFYVFLNAAGRKIADSNAMPDGTNIGFPGNAKELQVFVQLIDRTAPSLGKTERAKIVGYLNTIVPH
jgi:thiol:disulfide interchange protein